MVYKNGVRGGQNYIGMPDDDCANALKVSAEGNSILLLGQIVQCSLINMFCNGKPPVYYLTVYKT